MPWNPDAIPEGVERIFAAGERAAEYEGLFEEDADRLARERGVTDKRTITPEHFTLRMDFRGDRLTLLRMDGVIVRAAWF